MKKLPMYFHPLTMPFAVEEVLFPASSSNGTPSFLAFSISFLSVSIPSYFYALFSLVSAGLPHIIEPHRCVFLQIEGKTNTCKKVTIHFISKVALLRQSGKVNNLQGIPVFQSAQIFLSLIPGLQIPFQLLFYFFTHFQFFA